MKDYCAYLTGIPTFHGSEMAEERVKQVIEAATGEKVVGVSICWNFKEQEDKVRKTLEYDMKLMDDEILHTHQANHHIQPQAATASTEAGGETAAPERTGLQKLIRKVDDAQISFWWG